jgi:cell division protein ZapA
LVKPLASRNLLPGSAGRAANVEVMPRASAEVEIFGEVYNVRGGEDSEHLQELADLVDRKMREVAQHVHAADTARIAILAALNLADELSRLSRRQEGERVLIREKVAELTEELTVALKA